MTRFCGLKKCAGLRPSGPCHPVLPGGREFFGPIRDVSARLRKTDLSATSVLVIGQHPSRQSRQSPESRRGATVFVRTVFPLPGIDGWVPAPVARELQAIVREMSADLFPIDASVRRIGRRLDLRVNLAWKFGRMLRAEEVPEIVAAIPGDRGRRTVLEALESARIDASLLARLRDAFDRFDQVCESLGIESTELAVMAGGDTCRNTRPPPRPGGGSRRRSVKETRHPFRTVGATQDRFTRPADDFDACPPHRTRVRPGHQGRERHRRRCSGAWRSSC